MIYYLHWSAPMLHSFFKILISYYFQFPLLLDTLGVNIKADQCERSCMTLTPSCIHIHECIDINLLNSFVMQTVQSVIYIKAVGHTPITHLLLEISTFQCAAMLHRMILIDGISVNGSRVNLDLWSLWLRVIGWKLHSWRLYWRATDQKRGSY